MKISNMKGPLKNIYKNSLRLFEYAVDNNYAKNQRDLCIKIGLQPTNLADIRNEKRTFTHEQLFHLAKLTGANINWVYGLSEDMFLQEKVLPPEHRIRQALAEIEARAGIKRTGKKKM